MTSKISSPMSNLIKPVLVVWASVCKSCRMLTKRLKNWGNKMPTATKKLITFLTIRAYRLYLKPFERSWLATPRQSSSRPLWHWEDLQIVGIKILLANPPPQRPGLHKRLWRLFSLQSSPPQALQWFSIIARTNASMERPFDRLYNRSTGINWWQKKLLRLYSGYRWSAYKDVPLQTDQNHP